MKNVNKIYIFLFAIIFLLLGYLIYSSDKKVTVVYVELEAVYNGFDMKKELETKLTNVQQARKNILDSLKIQLNALSISIKSPKEVEAIQQFQQKKQQYLAKEQNFGEENQNTTKAFSAQIWKQINQYAKDYGKSHGYTVILGGDGGGTLMYADETKNMTAELTMYINERYSGEKK
jgi:outer membrane protein